MNDRAITITIMVCTTFVLIFWLMAGCEKHRYDVNAEVEKQTSNILNPEVY